MTNSESSWTTFRGFPRLPKGRTGILVDRCLPKGIAPTFSRFKGFHAIDLAEVYDDSERTPDVQFLTDAGDHGWAVFTQNDEMLREPDEMAAIREHGTRVFTLTSSQLTVAGKGVLFGRHLVTIRRRLARPGPCFWRLYEDRKSHDIK